MGNWKIIRDESYLEHHGVKGQKWGVRHDPEPSEEDRRRAQEEYAAIKAAEKAKRKADKEAKKEEKAQKKKVILGGILLATGTAIAYNLIKKHYGAGTAKPAVTDAAKAETVKQGAAYCSKYGSVKLLTTRALTVR